MGNRDMRFIIEVVNESVNKGWIGQDQRREIEVAFRLIEHGLAVKDTAEVRKAVIQLSKILRSAVMK